MNSQTQKAQWDNEKNILLRHVQKLREEIEAAEPRDSELHSRSYDLNKAAELQYGKSATAAETAGRRGSKGKEMKICHWYMKVLPMMRLPGSFPAGQVFRLQN